MEKLALGLKQFSVFRVSVSIRYRTEASDNVKTLSISRYLKFAIPTDPQVSAVIARVRAPGAPFVRGRVGVGLSCLLSRHTVL